jgi:hypothetical protein
MHFLFTALILLGSASNAFASDWLRCTANLLQNMDSKNPDYFDISRRSKQVIFDYKRGTDKSLLLAIKQVGEPLPMPDALPQFGLVQTNTIAEASITVAFSSTFWGRQLEPGEFSLHIFENKNPKNEVLYTAVPVVYLPHDNLNLTLEPTGFAQFVLTCTDR